jgi:hypothetical protein
MLEIARGLLELGVSFSTVVEQSTAPPPKTRRESKGLGKRPAKYWVTMADLNAYKQRRNKILLLSAGRAIRLRGGLFGRIAAELVPDVQVLSGPIMCDSVIAQADGVYFVDDGVSNELLDCICGVYHVLMGHTDRSVSHSSWWPKQSIFFMSGTYRDQWSPRAEEFYQGRIAKFDAGDLYILRSKQWRDHLKYNQKMTDNFLLGSKMYATQFLSQSSRAGN